jgi:5-methylcytosine-specific restriction endonuclease McrA
MPRKKKTDRQKLIKKLDDLIRKTILDRDGHECVKCGKESTLQLSHVVGRRSMALRWDLKNLKTLCMRCHLYWWHKEPMESWMWFQREFPYRADYLLTHKNEITKMGVPELQELLDKLTKEKTPKKHIA